MEALLKTQQLDGDSVEGPTDLLHPFWWRKRHRLKLGLTAEEKPQEVTAPSESKSMSEDVVTSKPSVTLPCNTNALKSHRLSSLPHTTRSTAEWRNSKSQTNLLSRTSVCPVAQPDYFLE